MALMGMVRVLTAFMYGVLLGVVWECASMGVLLTATLVEHLSGTLPMAIIFLGLAAGGFLVAARADLGRPLLSILAFRLTAQLAMTVGTGSILLTTMLHDTPACTSDRLRASGWRRLLLRCARRLLPRPWLRRIFGVEPPYGPPFLRVLAAVISREWFGWVPTFGLPSLLSLPGSITFKPRRGSVGELPALDEDDGLSGWLVGSNELAGVYTYACQDTKYGDFYYLFRYQAFWMRPAAMALLHAVSSLLIKMLLMHAYASLFMLLAQANCREAFAAELQRRWDRARRWLFPRPEVRQIPIEPGDLCAFCHEELVLPAPDEQPMEPPAAPLVAAGDASTAAPPAAGSRGGQVLHCRWGCGKAVHRACAAAWGRNACVYCASPML